MKFCVSLVLVLVLWVQLLPASEPAYDTLPPELVRLRDEGRLTVKALWAWRLVPRSTAGMALEFKALGLDLIEADQEQLMQWARQADAGELQLTTGQRDTIDVLLGWMHSGADTAKEAPVISGAEDGLASDVDATGGTEDTGITGEIWEILKNTPKMRITMPLKTFEMIITPGRKISFPVDYEDGNFRIKGTGVVNFSKDGTMIERFGMDTESIDLKSGEVRAKEELRVGPFKLHTSAKRNHDTPASVTNASRLYYVYASGPRKDRGTLRRGEAQFGYDRDNNFVKQGFKWHDVERLSPSSNTYSHYETISFHFLENEN